MVGVADVHTSADVVPKGDNWTAEKEAHPDKMAVVDKVVNYQGVEVDISMSADTAEDEDSLQEAVEVHSENEIPEVA